MALKKKMFITHLKDLIWSAAYVVILFVNIFAVHFHYSEIFTYHFFNGLLAFNNLYAIQVYETVITELYLATILTVFSVLPLIWFHFICYLVSGFYYHEILRFNLTALQALTSFIFESTICIFFFLPHAFGRGIFKAALSAGGHPPLSAGGGRPSYPGAFGAGGVVLQPPPAPPAFSGGPPRVGYGASDGVLPVAVGAEGAVGVTQIYSYANVVNLTARLIIIWGILAIILRTTIWQRKYLPLIIFIMSVWVTPPDIKIQAVLTLVLFIYLEGHIWIRLWKARLKFLTKAPTSGGGGRGIE